MARAVARTVGERVRRGRELRGWLMDPAARLSGNLPADVQAWPEDWRFLWDERAGIMEHCGALSRAVAERGAEAVVRLEFARCGHARGPPARS